jgi:cobalt-zinc-cadmium efflux system outer membrane protein
VDASNAAAEDQAWLISGRQSDRYLGAKETNGPRSNFSRCKRLVFRGFDAFGPFGRRLALDLSGNTVKRTLRSRKILILAALTVSVAAQTQDTRLSLRGLTSEALKNNPEIVAAQKKYEAARQRPTQESSLPDPMLSLGYNSTGSPRPFAGIGRDPVANAGVMVSQEVPFPGKLKLRGGMAAKEAEAEFQQYQAVQLGVLSRLKQAYYRLQYTSAASGVLTRSRELLNKLLKVTESRYSVGKAAQQDVFKAQTQISILETRLVKLDQERMAREAEINSLSFAIT